MKLLIPNKKAIFGYTLIELLVVTSIMGILFTVGIASYNRFNRTQVLQQAALALKSNLRLAQNKALSGEKPDTAECVVLWGYQVSFFHNQAPGKDGYKIKPGCDGKYLDAWEKSFDLPSSITFKTVPSPIFFKGLAQGLDQETTITLTGFGLEKAITVTKTGEIK